MAGKTPEELKERAKAIRHGTVPVIYEPQEEIEPDDGLVLSLPAEYPKAGLAEGGLQSQRSYGTGARKWNRDVAAEVLLRVASGATLREVCSLPGMPSAVMWSRWCMTVPELRALWREAQLLRASAAFDEAIDVARENARGAPSTEQTAAARLLIETLKWAAAKLSPKEFGERLGDKPFVSVRIYSDLDLNFSGETGQQGEIIDLDTDDDEVGYSLKVPVAVPATEASADHGGDSATGDRYRHQKRHTSKLEDKRGAKRRERLRGAANESAKELEE